MKKKTFTITIVLLSLTLIAIFNATFVRTKRHVGCVSTIITATKSVNDAHMSLALEWSPVPGANGYQVEFKDSWHVETKDSYLYDTTFTDADQFRVRAFCLTGEGIIYGDFSDWNYINTIYCDSKLLKVPGARSMSNLEREETPNFFNGTLSLQWAPIPGANGYEIEFSFMTPNDNIKINSGEFASNPSYWRSGAFHSLNEGNEKFRIRAYYLSNGGEKTYGAFSDWFSLNIE